MLYLTEKSSAPATVRRSTSARIAARARRIARRSAARVYRAARIAASHSAPAAVLITPITPAARVAAMLITDDITGRFTRHAAAVAVARVYPRPVLTRTNGGYCYIQPDGPAYLAPVDNAPAYRRPAVPYTGGTAESVPVSYHPGIKAAAPTAAPAPLYKSSYAAQHTMHTGAVSPLMGLAGAVACNVVKRRIQDTMPTGEKDIHGDGGLSRFNALLIDNARDFRRNNAAQNMENLAVQYEHAAAALDAAQTLAKRDVKILGLTGHVKSRYIAENTAAEKAALQSIKDSIAAAEKCDNTTISDFADIKSAAYIAGYELLTQFARWTVKNGGKAPENIDCDDLINTLIARNNAEKDDLTAARAAVDAAKDAARRAGYARLMDFAPYRDAKEQLKKYRRRNLVIVMSSAARTYIGSVDHGGNVHAADIDGAARRAKDVQSAENAALYKAVDNAAVYDEHYTAARADILNTVQDARARAAVACIIDGYTMDQTAARLAQLYPAEKWYKMRVSRLIAAARADIAAADGYRDNIQCAAYLDAIAARIK